jgi:hypothetical protein
MVATPVFDSAITESNVLHCHALDPGLRNEFLGGVNAADGQVLTHALLEVLQVGYGLVVGLVMAQPEGVFPA